jgi:hypothetical protein
MVACDKTENEQEIVDTFFGNEGGRVANPRNYDDIHIAENVYMQDFNTNGDYGWPTGLGINDGKFDVDADNYVITGTGKGPTGVWKDLPSDIYSKDFQIEAFIKHDFLGNCKEQALLFGVEDNGNSMYFIECEYGNDPTFMIGKNSDNWFTKQIRLDLGSYHLYTIRKFGEKLYFFLDKSFLYTCNAFNFQNYGFYVGKGTTGAMYIDSVTIDYIAAKEKE